MVELPLENEEEFNIYLLSFISEDERGQDYVSEQSLGFDLDTGRLKYMNFIANSQGESRFSRSQKLPIRDGWDEVVRKFE